MIRIILLCMFDWCKKIFLKFQWKEFIQSINIFLEFNNVLIKLKTKKLKIIKINCIEWINFIYNSDMKLFILS